MKKVKVLYIHPALTFGGAEVQRLELLKKWKSSKYKASILCIEKMGAIGYEIKKLGIPVYCLNQSSKPYNLKATFLLWLFLIRNRFDIVQTCLFNANFHGRIAAFLAGVKFIFSEEHSEHYQYTSMKFLPNIWADKILSGVTSKIICCCDTLRKDIAALEKINPKKIVTILSSINLENIKTSVSGSELKRDLKVPEENFVIGTIGSMSPRKGHEYLLRAFHIVKKAVPNLSLIFIGHEEKFIKKNLEELAKNLNVYDSVYFLGKKERIIDYYSMMDIFVLSSLCEGIPLVILEAMQMGIPVVSTNVGGIPEMISNNETGILVPSQDPQSLSNSIIDLLLNSQKRQYLAKVASEKSLDRFKPDRYLTELESLYSAVLSGKR